MTLYNCRHSGNEYRITKFDSLGNVESSYLCTLSECQCPAGVRPTCRHRDMLPKFIQRGAVDTGWQLDWDRGGWVDMRTEDEVEPEALPDGVERDELTIATYTELPEGADVAEEFAKALYAANIPGVQVISIGGTLTLHNAIAEAVGEPEARLPAPAKWRRF